MSTASPRLYETDFYGWVQQQVSALRAGRFASLDLDNLIEEIEDMGKREKQELRSRLAVLFMHLLKWQHQPARRGKSWEATIKTQRYEIALHTAENPSLKHTLPGILGQAWRGALIKASNETGLPEAAFPPDCPWTFEQVMDADFWPDA